MTQALAVEHGCTSILGLAIVGLIAWGAWRFGYPAMFREPLGRLVMGLAVLDGIGLVFWA